MVDASLQERADESSIADSLADEIIAEQAAEHRRDMRQLDAIARLFLTGADGEPELAERLLDDFVDLILEGGCLSLWRYRLLVAAIREGL